MDNGRTRGVNWDDEGIERKGDDYQMFPDSNDESENVEECEDDQQGPSNEEGE